MSAPSPSVALIGALSAVWEHIRVLHPDVPDVVVLPAPSSDRRFRVLGHFAPLRWRTRDGPDALVHEVVVVAEHLDRSAEDIVETLLHEAAHAMNRERGIFDCSPTSQYHNKRFAAAAEEIGLEVYPTKNYGFAYTELPAATAERYRAQIEALDSVLLHRRRPASRTTATPGGKEGGGEHAGTPPRARSRLLKATCNCETPYIIRASRTVLSEAEIVCRTCDGRFLHRE